MAARAVLTLSVRDDRTGTMREIGTIELRFPDDGIEAGREYFDQLEEFAAAGGGRQTITRFSPEFLLALLLRWEEAGVPMYNPLTASDRLRNPFQLARLAEARAADQVESLPAPGPSS